MQLKFETPATIAEMGAAERSSNADLWVNSGGYLYTRSGIALTAQGKLPDVDPYRRAYARANAEDTEDGYRPQNIFRLVTRAPVLQSLRRRAKPVLHRHPRRRESDHQEKAGREVHDAGRRARRVPG
jgi:hypothetical protein